MLEQDSTAINLLDTGFNRYPSYICIRYYPPQFFALLSSMLARDNIIVLLQDYEPAFKIMLTISAGVHAHAHSKVLGPCSVAIARE